MHIMVVDDAPDVLSVLRAALNKGENIVRTFASGRDALEAITHSNAKFDCILLDIQMPDLDGIDVLRELRSRDAYRNTPVLMVTAMSQMSYLDKAFAAGATDFITKPFDIARLRARISHARKKRTADPDEDVDGSSIPLTLRAEAVAEHLRSNSLGAEAAHFIEPVHFDNLLLRASEMNDAPTSVMAVKILEWTRISTTVSEADVQKLLSSISETLEGLVHNSQGFVAYRGGGVFLVIEMMKARYSQSAVEQAMDRAVAGLDIGESVKLAVGERKTSRLFDHADALVLLQSALGSLTQKVQKERVVTMPPRRVLASYLKSALQKSYERVAYRETLHDVIHDDDSLVAFEEEAQRRRKIKTDT